MRYLHIDSITISPDRQRHYFDPDSFTELQNSVERLGLIHAITVAADGTLVAGERRLRVLKNLHFMGISVLYDGKPLPPDMVPCILPSEETALMHHEIELEENITRADLTWQEKCEALRRLQALRKAQAERAQMPEPTVASLAIETEGRSDGAYHEKVRKSLIVSKHLDKPEIAKAKSVDEAFKILKKQEVQEQNAQRAAEMGTVAATERLSVMQGDCIELGWKWVESKAPLFDIICTDPPYGMNAQDFGDAGGSYAGIKHNYVDSAIEWEALMNSFAQLSFAITKPDAHMYVACDVDGFATLRLLFQQAGWRVHRTPLVYYKKDANRVPWPTQGPRRSYELVLYAVKGTKPVTAIYDDVFAASGDENLGHAAQKPVAFWDNLLLRSARPGDRILDAFAGTGGILIAAENAKCHCLAIEQDAANYGICLKRLGELK